MKSLSMAIVAMGALLASTPSWATTWDEPWHDVVVHVADAVVLADVASVTKERGCKVNVIRQVAGERVESPLRIEDYFLLRLGSASGEGAPRCPLMEGQRYYLFIKSKDDALAEFIR